MRKVIGRLIKNVLFMVRSGLDPITNFREISILAYHTVSDAEGELSVSPSSFISQMDHLKNRGYRFVSLWDIVTSLGDLNKLPLKSVALTFDDGYADFETNVLPVLVRFQAPATVFVVTNERLSRPGLENDIPLLSQEALVRLSRHPLVEIGFHSRTHRDPMTMSRAELREEYTSKIPARLFAYPGGSYTSEISSMIRDMGFSAACSIQPGLVGAGSDRYALPRNVIFRSTSPHDTAIAVSKAVAWFEALTRPLRLPARMPALSQRPTPTIKRERRAKAENG
jgi:peptidoglycan/xylan/chitin deacetylase (PgdA/CDA1 family)